MNNEQTQAISDQIVEELMDKGRLQTAPGMPSQLCYDHTSILWDELSVKISSAINQATADLRAENEKLKSAEYWTDWVYPEGAKPEDIQKELTDYHFILTQVSLVYEDLTGGRMSKALYYAKDVIAQAREVQEDDTQEAIAEATKELQAELKAQQEHYNSCLTKLQVENERLKVEIYNLKRQLDICETNKKNGFNTYEAELQQQAGVILALRGIIERLIGPVPNPEMFPVWFKDVISDNFERAKEVLTNTTEAAKKARDAVRREVIEEVIKKIDELSFEGNNGMAYGSLVWAYDLKEALKTQEGK